MSFYFALSSFLSCLRFITIIIVEIVVEIISDTGPAHNTPFIQKIIGSMISIGISPKAWRVSESITPALLFPVLEK